MLPDRSPATRLLVVAACLAASCTSTVPPAIEDDGFDTLVDDPQGALTCTGLEGASCFGGTTWAALYRTGVSATTSGELLQFFTARAGTPRTLRLALRTLRPASSGAALHVELRAFASVPTAITSATLAAATLVASANVPVASLGQGETNLDLTDTVHGAFTSSGPGGTYGLFVSPAAGATSLLVGVGALSGTGYGTGALRRGRRVVDGTRSDPPFRPAGTWDLSFGLDFDDCLPAPCQNGAICGDTGEGHTCACTAGFSGANCETNVDDCAPNPCANGATCTDDLNGFACACPVGFVGPLCETNADDCAPNPCANGGTCTDEVNAFTCACVPGYSGETCATNTDDCAPAPCQNGATCSDGLNAYSCTCVPGFTGPNCETNPDDCAPNPCQHAGTCSDGLDAYACACAPGYDGANCETNIDDCAPNPCQNGGTCTDGVNSHTCACPAGFTGPNCATNIDECASSPCVNGGTCVDGANAYSCTCPLNFGGVNCQIQQKNGVWPLNEGTGTITLDQSVDGNAGTLVGSPSWQSGASCHAGACVSFDGTVGRAITVPYVASLKAGTGDFTATAWARSSLATGERIIIGANRCFFSESWLLSLVNGKAGFATFGTGSVGTYIAATSTTTDGRWHHYAARRSGTALALFVDGVVVATGTVSASYNSDSGGTLLTMGNLNNCTGREFSGALDDLTFYRRALSNAEIATLGPGVQNATAPTPPTITSASSASGTGTVAFNVPSSNGGSPITGYIVRSNPGNITAVRTSSPASITGLLTGTNYQFTVTATNTSPFFSETFPTFQFGITGNQCTTGLIVRATATLPGWTATGTNVVHAVEWSSGRNAVMLFDTNALIMTTGVALNAAGVTYRVNFLGGAANWNNCSQGNASGDGVVMDVVRANGTVLATNTYTPPVWVNTGTAQQLSASSFTYVGDGSGVIKLRLKDNNNANGRFGGSIGDLWITTDAGTSPNSVAAP